MIDYGKYADGYAIPAVKENSSFADYSVKEAEVRLVERDQESAMSSANLLLSLEQSKKELEAKSQAIAILQKQNMVLRLKTEINDDKDEAIKAKNDLIQRAELALTEKEIVINQNELALEESKIEIDIRRNQLNQAREELSQKASLIDQNSHAL